MELLPIDDEEQLDEIEEATSKSPLRPLSVKPFVMGEMNTVSEGTTIGTSSLSEWSRLPRLYQLHYIPLMHSQCTDVKKSTAPLVFKFATISNDRHTAIESTHNLARYFLDKDPACPSPFSLLQFCIREVWKEIRLAAVEAAEASEGSSTGLELPLDNDSFFIAAQVSNASTSSVMGLQLLLRKLSHSPHCVDAFPRDLVQHCVSEALSCVSQGRSREWIAAFLSIVGVIVNAKGDLDCIVLYLQALEAVAHSSFGSLVLPHADQVVSAFPFFETTSKQSVLGCPSTDSRPLYLLPDNPECRIDAIGISQDGQHVAIVRGVELVVFSRSSGEKEGSSLLPTHCVPCWSVVFSEQSPVIVITGRDGCCHAVYSMKDFHLIAQQESEYSHLAVDWVDNSFVVVSPPLLPSGSQSTLVLLDGTKGVSKRLERCRDKQRLCMAAVVHSDYRGHLFIVEMETGSDLTVSLEDDAVVLTLDRSSCRAVLRGQRSQWLQLHVQWCHGEWIAYANNELLHICGTSMIRSPFGMPVAATVLSGKGPIAALAMWYCSEAVDSNVFFNAFLNRRPLKSLSCQTLLYYPLDEGCGYWIKDLASNNCDGIDEYACVWDTQIHNPLPCLRSAVSIRVPAKGFSSRRIMLSAYRLYLLPSRGSANSSSVIEVDRQSNTITRDYRCDATANAQLFAVRSDESELLVCDPLFTSFKLLSIVSPHRYYQQLASQSTSEENGTVLWTLEELSKKLYIRGCCHRFQSTHCQVQLVSFLECLRAITVNTNRLYILGLLSLCDSLLSGVDGSGESFIVSSIVSMNDVLKQLIDLFSSDSSIRVLASRVLMLATALGYSIQDKCNLLFSTKAKRTCSAVLSEKDLMTVVLYAAERTGEYDFSELLVSLFEEAEQHSSTEFSQWTLYLTISSIHALTKAQQYTTLQGLFSRVLVFISVRISKWTTPTFHAHSKEHLVLLSAVLPFCVTMTECISRVTTIDMEHQILSVIEQLKAGCSAVKEEVSFNHVSAHQLFAPRDASSKMWSIPIDFSKAKSVCISIQDPSHTCSVLLQGQLNCQSTVLNVESTSTTVPGDSLVVFGYGDNTLKAVAQYTVEVDGSWGSMLIDALSSLLMIITRSCWNSAPVDTSKVRIPLSFRYGLNSATLWSRGISVEARQPISTFSEDILNGEGDGMVFTRRVCESMRGSILPSMKPAIQYLLAILVHCGASEHEAEKEVRQQWFSGNWALSLQGSSQRASGIERLKEIATWVVTKIHFDVVSTAHGFSRSSSKYSQTASSLQTSRKHFCEVTDLLHTIQKMFLQEFTVAELENALVHQTQRAISFCHGAMIARGLLYSAHDSDSILQEILVLLLDYTEECKEFHIVESVLGCGQDIENHVREAFHKILEDASEVLLRQLISFRHIEEVTQSMPSGACFLTLLALYAYPWEEADFALMDSAHTPSSGAWVLTNLSRIFTKCSITRSDGCLGAEEDLPINDERSVKHLSMIDVKSIGRSMRNHFSVSIPQVIVSENHGMISIMKASDSVLFLRADFPWVSPVSGSSGADGNESFIIQYFEVQVVSYLPEPFVLGLTCETAGENNQDFVASVSSHGKAYHSVQYDHDSSLVFNAGDVIGCGLDGVKRKVFYTKNGQFWFATGLDPFREQNLFPSLLFPQTPNAEVCVNFSGESQPFLFDHRQMHPSLLPEKPSWYLVGLIGEAILNLFCSQLFIVNHESSLEATRKFRKLCCSAACEHMKNLSSVIQCVTRSSGGILGGLTTALSFKIAELSILFEMSSLRHLLFMRNETSDTNETICSLISEVLSVVMVIPFQSTQLAALQLMKDMAANITLPDKDCEAMIRALFMRAKSELSLNSKERESRRVMIPYPPRWHSCDTRNMAIMSSTSATMLPNAKVSVVIGHCLPCSGKVSFVVKIHKEGVAKGRPLQSGYYIGVALKDVYRSNVLQPWIAKKPPCVWALHDVSPQLTHATNPTVRANAFMRAFGADEAVKVLVDRDKGTVSFVREDTFLEKLFTGLPAFVDLVPFVQLYNHSASVTIYPGTMTAPITSSTILSAYSVDVLRCMLSVERFENAVARLVRRELDSGRVPVVTFALFNSVPDPRRLELCSHPSGRRVIVNVSNVDFTRVRYVLNDTVEFTKTYNFQIPAKPHIACTFSIGSESALNGLTVCIQGLIDALYRHTIPHVLFSSLCYDEIKQRQDVIDEESDCWDTLFAFQRAQHYRLLLSLERPLDSSLFSTDGSMDEHEFTFSAPLSNPMLSMMPQYLGKLVQVQDHAPAIAPNIAIADPTIPDAGICNLRCRIRRKEDSQSLCGGYYFGICTEDFSFKNVNFNLWTESQPMVWALHDVDTAAWRLPHMLPDVQFLHKICFFGGDIVRLEIDREAGTMNAYRKPYKGDEIFLGCIFDSIPNVPLRPFVCLYNNDSSAVLLDTEKERVPVRVCRPKPKMATFNYSFHKYCSSCSMNQMEEVQLTGEWYKCNECVDFSLCADCFYRCVHPHHNFSAMSTGRPIVHCPSPPREIFTGMTVFVPSRKTMYLQSHCCTIPEEHIGTVAISKSRNAFAVWGLLEGRGRFSVSVESMNSHEFSTESPVIVGLTTRPDFHLLSTKEAQDFILHSFEHATAKNVATVCSDQSLDRRGSRGAATGISSGAIITFDIDLTRGTVKTLKNWVYYNTTPLLSSSSPVEGDTLSTGAPSASCLYAFVMFGGMGQKAVLYPEGSIARTATVTKVREGVVHIDDPVLGSRVVLKTECRIPLTSALQHRKVLSDGELIESYVFDSSGSIVQCTAGRLDAEKNTVDVTVENQKPRSILINQLLINPYVKTGLYHYRELNSSQKDLGIPCSTGYIVFQLLLILSCMMQNDSLAGVIHRFRSRLIAAIQRLSLPLSFHLQSNMGMVKRIQLLLQKPFVYSQDLYQSVGSLYRLARVPPLLRDSVSPDGVVCHLGEPGALYRVTQCFASTVEVVREGGDPNQRYIFNQTDCVEVKLSCGVPWSTVPDGLPSSKREYGLRKATGRAELATLEGQWKGEVARSKTTNEVDFHLKKEKCFESLAMVKLTPFSREPYAVFYEYYRYERFIRMILVQTRCTALLNAVKEKTSWNEVISALNEVSPHDDNFIVTSGAIDSTGMRVIASGFKMSIPVGLVTARLQTALPIQREDDHDICVLPDCVRKSGESCTTEEQNNNEVVSELIVLLSRHLSLLLYSVSPSNLSDFAERIRLFHRHPLALQLSRSLSQRQALTLVRVAMKHILDPSTLPIDQASLAKQVLVLLPECTKIAPSSVIWDGLHAVVFAIHQCDPSLRCDLVQLITDFVASGTFDVNSHNHATLFSSMIAYANRDLGTQKEGLCCNRDTSSIIELFLALPPQLNGSPCFLNIPSNALRFLIDTMDCVKEGKPTLALEPRTKLTDASPVKCLFGELSGSYITNGKGGSNRSVPRKKVYFEVVFDREEIGTYAVGWGTEQHKRTHNSHVGTDAYSFAFMGNMISIEGVHHTYTIPVSTFSASSEVVIGCFLDLNEGVAAWSRNGDVGPFVALPSTHLRRDPIFAFASTSRKIRLSLTAFDFAYPPAGYVDVTGASVKLQFENVSLTGPRSTLPIQDKAFYIEFSKYLSHSVGEDPLYTPRSLKNFPLRSATSIKDLHQYAALLSAVEDAIQTTMNLIDLNSETISSKLYRTFSYFKPLLREGCRLRLASMTPLTGTPAPKELTIQLNAPPTEGASILTPTVLFQLYKQSQDLDWSLSPLFRVSLYTSESAHHPIDMGGPYRQVWSLIAQETMLHPESAYLHTEVCRNPLFRFTNNFSRVCLVPDHTLNSPMSHALFAFFGKLLGYAAKASICLDIDLSPFLWKFIVEDDLDVDDYYRYVDSVVMGFSSDPSFFSNGMAEELIPSFADTVKSYNFDHMSDVQVTVEKTKIAEDCLLHLMDEQMKSIREGLCSVLPRRVVRCLNWRDLERLVCGIPNPTVKDVKAYIQCKLSPLRESLFWQIVGEMDAEQKASLFCFASGQRRLPLVKPISVEENSESEQHLPRAQSCSYLITIPKYKTMENFRTKLLAALSHQNEMDLA